ncbi:SMI1/KNR4 family protein [Actinomadura sp. NPDC000600]|uniref:SMI1/KNR4 family protein n=1 Tax=Actinomadura sp. NPDC000600 TaxID=3154262 RepID=UPI00339417F5
MITEDDLVFEAVRTRVESGDHLDERFGPPGVDTAGGGAFKYAPDGQLQRVYWRGTPEYTAAHTAGLFEPLPPLTPARGDAVEECEALLGRPLPSLLRRCYLELGDGGFGPAYGLEPLGVILRDYEEQQQNWPEAWHPMARALLPICNWGCGIVSYVDTTDPSLRMWAIDPNPAPAEQYEVSLFPQHFGIAEWMRRWVEGSLHQPWLLQDQKTGRWRGATDAETDSALETQ